MFKKCPNIIYFNIVILCCLIVVPFVYACENILSYRGKVGEKPQMPSTMTKKERNALVFVGTPEIEILEKYLATLSFKTEMACPAATVYYGTYQPDQVLPQARYRKTARERMDELVQEHSITINLADLMQENVDATGMKEKDGGVVVYRLEVYNPHSSRSYFFDSRFAFRGDKRIPTVIEGPFVDQVTETSAILSWDTDLATTGNAYVGTHSYSTGNEQRTHHELEISDLEPGKKYVYRIEIVHNDLQSETREHFFCTPARNLSKFRFATMGDSREGVGGGERSYEGVNFKVMERFTNDAFNKGADFIIHTGDLINGYTTSVLDFEMQLNAFKKSVEPAGHYLPIYEIMGNHEALIDVYADELGALVSLDKEGDESAEALFAEAFVNPTNGPESETDGAPTYDENVYYFDYAHCRFVVMNNNYWWCSQPEKYGANLEGYVLDKQFEWLKQVFQSSANDSSIQHLFLLAQEPMFPNGGHVHDAMWYSGGYPKDNKGIDRRYVVKRRDEIWKAFVATGKACAGVFGDEHNFSCTLIDSTVNADFDSPVWHIVSGGAGAPFYAQNKSVPWSNLVRSFSTQTNYLLLDVDGPNVILYVYGFTGELIDQIRLKP